MAFPDNLRSLGELPLAFHALSQVLGSVAATNVAAARRPVHVLPTPAPRPRARSTSATPPG
jgi:hypothetical protein